jgi:hypothetical protein
MKNILVLILLLTFASPSFAYPMKVRGSLTKTFDSCHLGDPDRMPLNQTLDCTYGYCFVRDKTNGVNIDGYYPRTTAVLTGSYGLSNGCILLVQYVYTKPQPKRNVPMVERFVLQCPGLPMCSVRYEGKAKFL